MEAIILMIIIMAAVWVAIMAATHRFHKTIYAFDQYGMQFRVVKVYQFYELMEVRSSLFHRRVGILDIPHYSKYGSKEIMEAAHALAAEEHPFEREEWERLEKELQEAKLGLRKIDETLRSRGYIIEQEEYNDERPHLDMDAFKPNK